MAMMALNEIQPFSRNETRNPKVIWEEPVTTPHGSE